MSEPHSHVIGIVGGAVSGSEAAAIAAERGALVVVIEQNTRPYGKIEDGLPRWHVALRKKEYARIDDNLAHANVRFVPLTRLGRDVEWATLTHELGLSALVLANGAWRDRPLPASIDAFVGRGLAYQNPFVYWFNHQLDADYDGPRFTVPDGAIVIGGGLASIDCVKIINFVLYGEALRARGIEVDVETMEHEGLPKILAEHGLSQEALGIRGATLFYRRRAEDMPLVSADDGSSARAAKLEATRVKLLSKVLEKYLVRFEPLCAPLSPLVVGEGDETRLGGVRFQKNAIVDGKLVATDEVLDVRTELVVSSIGSIPELIVGIPAKGELYLWKDWESGALAADAPSLVHGLGNVLTGKGNIVESRKSSKKVMAQVVDTVLAQPALEPAAVAGVEAWVKARWDAIGYRGDYRAWVEQHPPSA